MAYGPFTFPINSLLTGVDFTAVYASANYLAQKCYAMYQVPTLGSGMSGITCSRAAAAAADSDINTPIYFLNTDVHNQQQYAENGKEGRE